jgi:hypothetical protein
MYGLVMVMLHAYLLSEDIDSAKHGTSKKRGEFNWFLQVLDMDLSWGHRLMGFKDDECLLAGLLYGVAVLASCTLALSSVWNRDDDQHRLLEIGGGPGGWGRGRGAEIYRPWLPRWFIVFAHSQLIAYIFQVMTKSAVLCDMRHAYFPSLEANCSVLRFQYSQRAFLGAAISTLGLYILGSFAYLGQEEVGRSVGPRLGFIDEERPVSHQPQHKVVHSSNWNPAVTSFISRQPVAQYSQYQPVHSSAPSSLSGSVASISSTTCSDAGRPAVSWGVQEPVLRQTMPTVMQ